MTLVAVVPVLAIETSTNKARLLPSATVCDQLSELVLVLLVELGEPLAVIASTPSHAC